MNQQAVNEAISSWFEPKPSPADLPLREAVREPNSPKEAWHYSSWDWKWHPLEWDTDEAANARLVEAAGIHTWPTKAHEHTVEEFKGQDIWNATALWSDMTPYSHPERKTANVLAFLKFAGIEVAHVD